MRAALDPHQNYTALVPFYGPFSVAWSALSRGILARSKDVPTGDLAESWEISGDKTTVTFKLRSGVTWHDIAPVNGRPLDAEDILYSWKRFTEIGNQRTAYSNALNPDGPILSVRVTGPQARSL